MSEIQDNIRKLRKLTSAGILDCKKALDETKGDLDEAVKVLRKRGIAKADKKSDRETKEGAITSYIHFNGTLGVLAEVLCETDFVSRNEEFKTFAKEIATHIAAMEPLYVRREEIPQEVIQTEKDVYLGQLEKDNKPDNIKEKIVKGKLEKFYKNNCLYEQEFYKEDKKTVEEFIKEHIAKFGENIKISKFILYKIK
ncbi:translation elongation factor Ts [bacterium]|nr:translation elongation factor Ts [bacterium]